MTAPDDEIRPDPEAPARPRRLFFARLAAAVRRQDWFVVALEVAIVVLGVIIGFQVTAWGQSRTDRAKEQTYLRQLVADLEESERLFAAADSFHSRRVLPASSQLLSSFGRSPKPPADSVGGWFRWAWTWRRERPVLGTARALVSTGDLSLIQSDSLRSAILTYLDATEIQLANQARELEIADAAGYELTAHVDIPEWLAGALPDSTRERWSRSSSVPGIIPTGDWSAPFPLDPEVFYADRQAYKHTFAMALATSNFVEASVRMHQRTTALREMIEAEIGEPSGSAAE